MAYSTIKYGSSGEDVKTLQEYLNNNGYNLSVNGQFGSKTQAAVKDYQKKNGLSVDGIVGTNTWDSLSNKTKTTNKAVTTPVSNSTSTKTTTSATSKRPTYTESNEVTAAKNALSDWENNKPNSYVSPHADKINTMLDSILNGEAFNYNAEEDAIYQIYKDLYIQNGKKAMQDTIAQSAALTGGYGSSYGTAAGQQAYQQQLAELNAKVPELAEAAYQRYLAEQEGDYEKLALLQQQDEIGYGRYRDDVSDYNTQLSYLYQKANDLSDDDLAKYQILLANFENDRDFAESVRQYNEQMAYQKERDKVSDEQWEKTYNLQKSSSSSGSRSSGGSSGSSSGSGGSGGSGGLTDSEYDDIRSVLADLRGNMKDANGKIGANYAIAEKLDYFQRIYELDDDTVDALYQEFAYTEMPVKQKEYVNAKKARSNKG